MAELPRYQQTGRVFADVPQLDFANVRESYKLSQSMSGALDRLSEFAGKFAAKQVERQAEQYAIENPITIEQLQQAKQSGIDPDELIKATGGGAIWEDTLRKLQGEQLRAQLEVQGKAALTEIQALFDANQINDIAEVKSKFNSIIQGTAAPLARISPESAIKLQQSLGVTANAYYREATNKLADDYIRDQQMLSAKNLDYSVNAAKSMINTINDPALLTEAKDLLKIRLYEQSREGGTLFAQKQVETFNKEFDALKFNRLVEVATNPAFAPDMNVAIQRIRKGDFGDASLIYNELPKDEQAKIRTGVVSAWNDLYSAAKKEEEYVQLQNKEKDKTDIVTLYSKGTPENQKRQLAISLFKRGAITQQSLEEVLNPKEKQDDFDNLNEARAESQIISGYIKSEKELRQLYPGLNNKSVAKLLPKIASTNMQTASKIIRTQAGASESPFAVIDEPTAKRIQDINNIYNEIKLKTNPDGSFIDDVTAANQAANQYKSNAEYSSAKTSQKNTFSSISKNYMDFNPDKMSVKDYAKRKGLNAKEEAKLIRLYNDYNSYKKITGLNAEGL